MWDDTVQNCYNNRTMIKQSCSTSSCSPIKHYKEGNNLPSFLHVLHFLIYHFQVQVFQTYL